MTSVHAALRGIVERFPSGRVLVVGDLMLDHFVVGRVDRISPEAPVPVVAFEEESYRLGGAANVAHNVKQLGGQVTLIGLRGDDEAGERLAVALHEHGLTSVDLVRAPGRPTTRKMRIVTTRHQQVARVDFECDADVSGAVEAALVERLEADPAGAAVIVISDYLKGAITRRVVEAVLARGRRGTGPVLVDPKVPHLDLYAGATLVTPNHHEAETATHLRIRSAEDAREAARRLRQRLGCESVLITRGEQGMWLLDGRDGSEREIPAAAREVADVTGAGDTVIATTALALAAGAALWQAATLAAHAAGVAVSRFGPAAVSPEELRASLDVQSGGRPLSAGSDAGR